MGLLKHAILPFFAAFHFLALRAQLSVDTWAELLHLSAVDEGGSVVPPDDSTTTTLLLQHSMGILRAYNFVMAVLCMLGVVMESSHFRGILIVAEAAIFGISAVDAFMLDLDWIVPASMAAGAAIGAAIHAKEPGIFTVDKNKTTKTAKAKKTK